MLLIILYVSIHDTYSRKEYLDFFDNFDIYSDRKVNVAGTFRWLKFKILQYSINNGANIDT